MKDFISFETLKRPNKPNTYLVAPMGLCKACDVDAESPVLDLSPAELFDTLEKTIKATRNWKWRYGDRQTGQIRFIAQTPFLKFKDDVDIHIRPSPADETKSGSATLAIYSRSRIGYSDMGANKKRVESILAGLTAK